MSDRLKIHICETRQDTTAKLRSESIGISDYVVAILYDISSLKPFQMFSKVIFLGKEEWFYYNPEKGTLVSKDAKRFEEWIGKSKKESEEKSMLHNVTVKHEENKVLEEYWVMKAVCQEEPRFALSGGIPLNIGGSVKIKEMKSKPTVEEIAQFLSESKADFVTMEQRYKFKSELPF